MVSNATSIWRSTDDRQARSNSFRFQFTATTEINRLCYQARAAFDAETLRR